MVPRDLVKSGDFAGIQALTAEAVAMVRTLSTATR
jgi:hypothetical protein